MFKTSYSLVETLKKCVEIVNLIKSNWLYFYLFFLDCSSKKKIRSPTPEIEPRPAGWKPAILAIRPRGIVLNWMRKTGFLKLYRSVVFFYFCQIYFCFLLYVQWLLQTLFNNTITIFYTEILTRKVDLWSLFISKIIKHILHKLTFHIKMAV